MKPDIQDDSAITQKASEWFFVLPHADAGAQEAFGAWLKESPKHVAEFLMVSAAYQELDAAPAGRAGDIDTLRAEIVRNVLPLQNRTPSPLTPALSHKGRGGERKMALAAAVMVLALAAGWLMWAALGAQRYSTEVGEMRSFALADGSVIELNTHSRVAVDYSDSGRDVQLISGEALFKVARDPSRPFRVRAGDAIIEALGTQFNVYRRAQDTTVSVIEGAVKLSEASAAPAKTLAAGEEARVAAGGEITKLATADTSKATAWRQRRLVFRGESLTEVAAEFNRYNRTLQIRVEGDRARNTPLAGIFDADDPESLVQFLAGVEGLSTERRADEVIVSDR